MASPLTLIYEFGRFRVDRGNQRLTRDGMLLVTPGKIFPILLDLIEHRDQIIPVSKLIDSHFPKSPFGEEELTGEILKLKRLLDDTSKQAPIIRFTAGQGYQFEAGVTDYLGDSSSDSKFGSKPRERETVSSYIPTPAKPKTNILGLVVAVIAAVGIAVAIWRFMPAHSVEAGGGGGDAGSSQVAEFTGTPQVAILPFQSLTGHASDDSFNKSLTQGIFNALSKQPGLKVVPAEAVQKYVDSGAADPVSAGQQLGAQMIVRGMAQRLAGHLLVKVQLLSTQDGSQIWSTGFEGNSNDIAGLTSKISDKISKGAQP